jgi:purine-binding chemotaxis protein CheW
VDAETAAQIIEASDAPEGTQYLTFVLCDEHYGVDILRVQEIRGWETVTRIPNTPAYVKGVINLRGAIVPILDLRQRFGLPVDAYTKETVVIVLRSSGTHGERHVGVVVDAVSDVLTLRDQVVSRTPDFGAHVPTESIRGLVTGGDNMIMLLDVDALVQEAEPAEAPR